MLRKASEIYLISGAELVLGGNKNTIEVMTDEFKSKPLKSDIDAESRTSDRPAFLSVPDGAPVYHGFPLIEETRTEGWCYGAITEFEDDQGCEFGDGFVQAPDGSRAGLVWSVGNFETKQLCTPDVDRWGVYEIAFPKPTRTLEDLISCFRVILLYLGNKLRQ